MKQNQLESKPIRLRWYDPENQRFFQAGVGFYNGTFGDYTLKLNLGRGKVYLRPVSYEVEQTRFRVEEVKNENGRTIKEEVGFGVLDETTKGSIHIKLGGCSDILILG
ncbi:MAG: hypothetical protein ACLGGX_08435 [Bdellovibrionia bacterium]